MTKPTEQPARIKISLPNDEVIATTAGAVYVPKQGCDPRATLSFETRDENDGCPELKTTLAVWTGSGTCLTRTYHLSDEDFWEETFLEPVWYTTRPDEYMRSETPKGTKVVRISDKVQRWENCGRRCARSWVVDNIPPNCRNTVRVWKDTALLFRQKKFDYYFEAFAAVDSHGWCQDIYAVFSEVHGIESLHGPFVARIGTCRRFLLGNGLFEAGTQAPPNDYFKCYRPLRSRKEEADSAKVQDSPPRE